MENGKRRSNSFQRTTKEVKEREQEKRRRMRRKKERKKERKKTEGTKVVEEEGEVHVGDRAGRGAGKGRSI